MIRNALLLICTLAIFSPLAASAGEVRNSPNERIRQREINQQQRIHDGVKDGTINRQEARNLEKREASIEAARRRDLRNDGHLSQKERQRLNQRENNVSRAIYRDKHD